MTKRNCYLIGSGLLAIGMVTGILTFASHIDNNQLSFLVRATPEIYNIALNVMCAYMCVRTNHYFVGLLE